jgi:hypothetical protein
MELAEEFAQKRKLEVLSTASETGPVPPVDAVNPTKPIFPVG